MGMITTVRERVGFTRASQDADPEESTEEATPTSAEDQTVAGDPAQVEGSEEAEAKPVRKLSKRAQRKERRRLNGVFESYPHLLALKPKEKYVFRSDYFQVDDSVACVLAFFHKEAANDGFAPFWGVARIPDGLDDSVTTVLLEQIERRDDSWVESKIKDSERLERLDSKEQETAGTTRSKQKTAKISGDRDTIIAELANGAAYLSVHNRLLVKAPTLDILDDSLERISRLYVDRFGTLEAEPYVGEQRQELSTLMRSNDKKRGRGFHFTSTELAGSYSLVTNGLNDPDGEYVGFMDGDVNNSAVLMNVDRYDRKVIVADATLEEYMGRAHVSDMWCSKISQSALLSNHKVVHLVLDGADLDKLGPRFDGLTSRVDLNSGDVNMFEMFGDQSDELAIFAAQMQKLTLMFEQLYETEDASVGSIIRTNLEKMATAFYVDQRMWAHNAKNNRSRLRVVDIPHNQVPRLQMFVSYLETAHKGLLASEKNSPDQLRAYDVLTGVANNLLSTNGDLFNNHTVSAVDGVRDSRRVVYDFSRLMRRGKGVAMAQLVNIIGFAISTLGIGDTVIIHGVEQIDAKIKGYITAQFEALYQRGGRVVFSYNDVDKMLDDVDFNVFDDADYTVLGPMRDGTVAKYQKLLHQQIPKDLATLVTRRDRPLTFLRRGVTNVAFQLDLALGVNPAREKQRREMAMAAAKAAETKKFDALMDDEQIVPGGNLTGAGGSNADRAEAQKQARKHLRTARKKIPTPREPASKTAKLTKNGSGRRGGQ